MLRNAVCAILATVLIVLLSSEGQSFSLKTHLWISEQVIADIKSDCRISVELVEGSEVKEFTIPPDICAAIRQYPDKYRAGNLGPDVFPDPITGQMTTHPGDVAGWSSERWLRHVVNSAQSADELSFAYGFVGHASSDIFAHTFVNQYAGDIFLLSDKESQVELRHFSLEKYIEGRTPPLPYKIDRTAISVPSRFLSASLIYDKDVARQYRRQPLTYHLASLSEAKEAVDRLSKLSRTITDRIINFYASYYKLQLKEYSKIATFEREVETAKQLLKGAQKGLKIEADILDDIQKKIDDAEEIIEKYPEILDLLDPQILGLSEQIELAANLVQSLSKEKEKALNEFNKVRRQINGLICGKEERICRKKWVKGCWFCDVVQRQFCTVVDISDAACKPLQELADKFYEKLLRYSSEFDQAVVKRAALEAEKAALILEKANKEAKLAFARGAIAALRERLKLQQKFVEAKQKSVSDARRGIEIAEKKLEEIRKAAEPILALVDEIAAIAKEYNTIALQMQNWRDGIDKAGAEFIDASMSTGFSMINEDGHFLAHYRRWLECSALNYLGVPYQIPRAYCEAKDKLAELDAKIEELKAKLPKILRWLIDPLQELKKEARKIAVKEVWKAAKACADFVGGKPTGRFIGMLAGQEKATADAVRQIYANPDNRTGKKLLVFPDVLPLVDHDIGLTGNQLNPAVFHALRDAVVLTKLSLLAPSELNRLHAELAAGANRYAPELYENTSDRHFSLLFYAIRSIDGNHQWQPFGLPYLRSDKNHQPKDPAQRRYGYNVHDNKADGLRIFQDPIARENVFLRLFSGPVEGSMATIPEAQLDGYPYPACQKNPFPRTVDDFGKIILADKACADQPIVIGKVAPKAKTTAFPIMSASSRSIPRAASGQAVVTCDTRRFLFGTKSRVFQAKVSGDLLKDGRYRCTWGVTGRGKTSAQGWWRIEQSRRSRTR